MHGRRIQSADLTPGATLELGGVQCVTYVRKPSEDDESGILGHDAFVASLDRAVSEARYFSDELSIFMLRALRYACHSISPWRIVPRRQ